MWVAALPWAADGPDPELDAVLLHVLSHCATAADRVRKSNERLKAAAAAAAAAGGGGEAEEPPRDQGFVRPKVGGWCWGEGLPAVGCCSKKGRCISGRAQESGQPGGALLRTVKPPHSKAPVPLANP